MRNLFPGFYPPTEEESAELWGNGLIVLDTNVLLHLFRYTQTTRDELLTLLRSVDSRLWIPHQVALEFHQRRWSVVGKQEAGFDAVEKALKEAQKNVQAAIDSLHRGTSAETSDLTIKLNEAIARFRRNMDEHKERAADYLATFNAVSALFDGQVGSPYTSDHLKTLHAEGEERFAKKIPPGFEDDDKDSDRKYGDLVLWKQILDKGAESSAALIFVTEDGKDDWWERTSGKVRGPRPELVEEYFAATSKRVALFNVGSFLHAAAERGLQEVSKEAVEEAVETRQAVEAAERQRDQARLAAMLNYLEPTGETDGSVALRRTIEFILDHPDQFDASNVEALKLAIARSEPTWDLWHRAETDRHRANWKAFRSVRQGAEEAPGFHIEWGTDLAKDDRQENPQDYPRDPDETSE